MVLDMEGKPRGAHSATKIGYESQSLFIRSPSVALVQLRMPVNQSSMPIPSIPCMLNLGISSSLQEYPAPPLLSLFLTWKHGTPSLARSAVGGLTLFE